MQILKPQKISPSKFRFIPSSKVLKKNKLNAHDQDQTQSMKQQTEDQFLGKLQHNKSCQLKSALNKTNSNKLNSYVLKSSAQPNQIAFFTEKVNIKKYGNGNNKQSSNQQNILQQAQKSSIKFKKREEEYERQQNLLRVQNLKLHQQNKSLKEIIKQISEPKSKNKSQNYCKCDSHHQHSLIIDSLKKVIESQILKINSLEKQISENYIEAQTDELQMSEIEINNVKAQKQQPIIEQTPHFSHIRVQTIKQVQYEKNQQKYPPESVFQEKGEQLLKQIDEYLKKHLRK